MNHILMWVWTEIVWPSRWSIPGSILIIVAYNRVGGRHRDGFILQAVSNLSLAAVGVVTKQWALIPVAVFLAFQATWNWFKWSRTQVDPEVQREFERQAEEIRKNLERALMQVRSELAPRLPD